MTVRIFPPRSGEERPQPVKRLGVGLRIQRLKDEPVTLPIAERLRRQVDTLSRSSLNGQESLTYLESGEGALKDIQGVLQQMGDLAVQGLRDDLDSPARLNLQKEVDALREELNRISRGTEFNTRKLLDGSQGAEVTSTSPFARGVATGGLPEAVADFGVSITLVQAGLPQMQRSRIQYQGKPVMKLATESTLLRNILGLSVFEGDSPDTPSTLTLEGNGRQAQVPVQGKMTFGQLAAAFQEAMTSPDGLDIPGSGVQVVSTAVTGVAGVGGYLQMTSGAPGKDFEVGILGNNAIVETLGFSTVRPAIDMTYSVMTRDGQGNFQESKGQGNRVPGLLDGVDLLFFSRPAQIAGTTGIEDGLSLSADETFVLSVAASVAGVPIVLPRGKWSLSGLARSIQAQMDETVNGVATISGVSTGVVDGQVQLKYEPSAPMAGRGNQIAVSSYAGSVLNLPEGAFPESVSTMIDPSRVFPGISRYFDSDTGIVSGTAVTIKVGDGKAPAVAISVFSTLGTLGPGSRVVPDLIPFSDWQKAANRSLESNSVMVRLYHVGGTMAFTALRIGRETHLGEEPIESKVELSDLTAPFNRRFGLEPATQLSDQGEGDTNFKLHAVNRSLQHRIEENSPDVLKMGFADMGATALGVDKMNVSTIEGASEALNRFYKAADRVTAELEKYQTWKKELAESLTGLQNAMGAIRPESRISDTALATEVINYARNQILGQSRTAMAAQANLNSANVFQLLSEITPTSA